MPIYNFKCSNCEHEAEKLTSISEAAIILECPNCKEMTFEKISSFGQSGLIFKGNGYYITDFKGK